MTKWKAWVFKQFSWSSFWNWSYRKDVPELHFLMHVIYFDLPFKSQGFINSVIILQARYCQWWRSISYIVRPSFIAVLSLTNASKELCFGLTDQWGPLARRDDLQTDPYRHGMRYLITSSSEEVTSRTLLSASHRSCTTVCLRILQSFRWDLFTSALFIHDFV